MKTWSNYTFGLLGVLLIALVSCSKKEVQRTEHEKTPEISEVPLGFEQKSTYEIQAEIKQLYQDQNKYWTILREVRADNKNEVTSADQKVTRLYREIVETHKPYLYPKYSRDTSLNTQDEYVHLIRMTNRALVELFANVELLPNGNGNADKVIGKNAMGNTTVADLIDEIESLYLYTCPSDKIGISVSRGCGVAQIFLQDRFTGIVAAKMAKFLSPDLSNTRQQYEAQCDSGKGQGSCGSIEQKYRALARKMSNLVSVAYGMGGMSRSNLDVRETDFEMLFLQHAKDLKWINSDGLSDIAAARSNEDICDIFKVIVMEFGNQDTLSTDDKDKYNLLLDSYEPYRLGKQTGFCQEADDVIRSQWLKNRMVVDGKLDPKGIIKKQVKAYLSQKHEPVTDYKVDVPFSYILQEVNSEPALKQALNIKPIRQDIYFFVINEVFYGRLSPEGAQQIWQEIEGLVDESIFYDELEKYLRSQTAYLVSATNKHMQEFFAKAGFTQKTVFTDAISHIGRVKGRWSDLKDRSTKMKRLINLLFSTKYLSRTGDGFVKFKKREQALDSLGEQINFISVWPNMMVLSYFLAKFEGEVEYRSWWTGKKVTIKIDDILADVYEGRMWPWFDFGDRSKRLDKYQTLYAFDFMTKTQTMKYYSQATEVVDGVEQVIASEKSFFERSVEKYIKELREEINVAHDQMKRVVGSSDMHTFKAFCANPDRQVVLKMDDLEDTAFIKDDGFILPVKKLLEEPAQGAKNSMKNLLISAHGKAKLWEILVRFRGNFDMRVDYLRMMQRMFSSYLASLPELTDKERVDFPSLAEHRDKMHEANKYLKDSLDDFLRRKQEFIADAMDYNKKDIADCLFKLAKEEKRRKVDVLKKEAAYIKDVHASLTLLNAFKTSSDKMKLNKKEVLEWLRRMFEGDENSQEKLSRAESLLVSLGVEQSLTVPVWEEQIKEVLAGEPMVERLYREEILGYVKSLVKGQAAATDVIARVEGILKSFDNKAMAQEEWLRILNDMLDVHSSSSKALEYKGMAKELVKYLHVPGIRQNGQLVDWSGSNSISPQGWDYNKADLSLRLKLGIEKDLHDLDGTTFPRVAYNTTVMLDTNFLDWGYLDNSGRPVPYSPGDTQEKFVASAMKNVDGASGYTDWLQGSESPIYALINLQLRTYVELFKLGRISRSIDTDCSVKKVANENDASSESADNQITSPENAGDGCIEVSAKELINYTLQVADEIIHIDDDMAQLLAWVNVDDQSVNGLNSYFIQDTDASSTLFNGILKIMHKKDNASENMITPGLEEIKSYYLSEKSMFRIWSDEADFTYGIFDYDQNVAQTVRQMHRPKVMQFISRIKEFKEEVRLLEKRDYEAGVDRVMRFKRSPNGVAADTVAIQDDWRILIPTHRTDHTPVYLNDLGWWPFKTYVEQYFMDTRCALLPRPQDPDFASVHFERVGVCENDVSSWLKAIDL